MEGFADLIRSDLAEVEGPQIRDGDTVVVVGGGPAGSAFAIFFLSLARRLKRQVDLVIFEQKDFGTGGPGGCNQCGGVLSENLLGTLAIEGIVLKDPVVQRGINRYRLITRDAEVELINEDEQRSVATVYRAGGPSRTQADAARSFDRHMLGLAEERGAHIIRQAANRIERDGDGFRVSAKGEEVHADLLVGAFGHRKGSAEMFEGLGFGYARPARAQTLQCEIPLDEDEVAERFGGSICVTMPPLKGIHFVGITPKSQGLTMSVLGNCLDRRSADRVLGLHEIVRLLPEAKIVDGYDCVCMPWITVGCAKQPFGDRVVVIGDPCVSRLYKDGIGSALTTANAAARAALLFGISKEAFARAFWPVVRDIDRDNRYGRLLFGTAHTMAGIRAAERTVVNALRRDLQDGGTSIAQVIWDMLTGSCPYADIFRRAVKLRTAKMLIYGGAAALRGRGGDNG